MIPEHWQLPVICYDQVYSLKKQTQLQRQTDRRQIESYVVNYVM